MRGRSGCGRQSTRLEGAVEEHERLPGAYTDLAGHIDRLGEPSWTKLYQELAEDFRHFVDVLAEVSDRTLGCRPDNLLRLYERFILTHSDRDRDRLLRLGYALPDIARSDRLRFWQ